MSVTWVENGIDFTSVARHVEAKWFDGQRSLVKRIVTIPNRTKYQVPLEEANLPNSLFDQLESITIGRYPNPNNDRATMFAIVRWTIYTGETGELEMKIGDTFCIGDFDFKAPLVPAAAPIFQLYGFDENSFTIGPKNPNVYHPK